MAHQRMNAASIAALAPTAAFANMLPSMSVGVRGSQVEGSSIPDRDATIAFRREFTHSFQMGVQTVGLDRRDEWATDIKDDYSRGDVISCGQFGMVVAALGRDFTFGGTQAQPRACAIKVVYLARRFDRVSMHVAKNLSVDEAKGDYDKFSRRVEGFTQKLVTELYILNRCRHENIMHSHAVVVSGGDVHIVLPRLYSLEALIDKYRQRYQGESIPARIIMMIIRQICLGLDFLLKARIIHRDIQSDYIYLTRGGTVKIGHFSSARILGDGACVTPVGKKEYMCFEKQFNLYSANSREECLEYDGAADIWSIGVLTLRMISYFPNEKWHRLQPDFATLMHVENMPFKWMIAEMMQLRVRLAKCGGKEDLRSWLSDRVLTVDTSRRATAAELLQTPTLKKLCSETVAEDKKYLNKHFILALDWPNRMKLETTRPNYDALESKDIPAEFYWDEYETWKELERREFSFEITVEEDAVGGSRKRFFQDSFMFSSAHVLLRILSDAVNAEHISFIDILPIDYQIREMACVAIKNEVYTKLQAKRTDTSFALPSTFNGSKRVATVSVRLLPLNH